MSGQSDNQVVKEELTGEQVEIYKEFNRMLESLDIQNMFKDF